MSGSVANLPPPDFVSDQDGLNPKLILADMVASFEQASGRVLYPAQVERLLVNLYAYREALVRNAIQYAGEQNLLAYAVYPALDYLGQLLGVTRLAATPATTTIEFTLTGALTVPLLLTAGTQVGTSDGSFIFTTDSNLTIQAGATTGSVSATCTTTGTGGNGYLAGQVDVLIGANAVVQSVQNTSTTANGAAIETDSHLRTRIQAAPNQFSTAGPAGAYRYWALSASPAIVDADVVSPSPGTVSVYILCGPIQVQPAASPNAIGIADSSLIASAQATLSGNTVRPLCDTVNVYAVTEVDYTITATVTLFANAAAVATQQAAMAAAVQLALDLANSVKADLVPSQWVSALSVAGVYEVTLTIAANIGGTAVTPQSDGRIVLTDGQWPNCTAINLTYATSMEVQG